MGGVASCERAGSESASASSEFVPDWVVLAGRMYLINRVCTPLRCDSPSVRCGGMSANPTEGLTDIESGVASTSTSVRGVPDTGGALSAITMPIGVGARTTLSRETFSRSRFSRSLVTVFASLAVTL